jgi:radical SAM enzyme (TIGR01210 family)
MKELADFCKNLKKDFTPRIRDSTKPVKYWSEKDFLKDKIVNTYVIIFRTRGCKWSIKSGCTMCGYYNDSLWNNITDEDLLKQFETSMEKYNGEKFVKIFNSGSFLDDNEIRPRVRLSIMRKLAENVDKISIESRPEFITDEKLLDIKNAIKSTTFEIGIGLETANDFIREYAINKGFSFKDYKTATDIIKKNNCRIKTYLLVKPPFLTEKESIEDNIKTVHRIKDITDIISINPVNIQRNTLVEYLWRRKQYCPPWLWSIVEIIKEGKKIIGDKRIKCDIVGGGNVRGANNCRNCNNKILEAISSFSINQEVSIFKDLNCECYEKWLDQIDIEKFGFGSLTCMYR